MRRTVFNIGGCLRSVQQEHYTSVGVSRWHFSRCWASTCRSFKPPWPECRRPLLAVTPSADWLERLDLAGAILEPCLTFKDGQAQIADLPGAGLEWRESEV